MCGAVEEFSFMLSLCVFNIMHDSSIPTTWRVWLTSYTILMLLMMEHTKMVSVIA